MTHPVGLHVLPTGLMGLLGQPWEGLGQGIHSLGVCNLDSCLLLCPCALLGLWRGAFDEMVALLWWAWEQQGQVINQVTATAIVSLCLLLCVRMSCLSHNLTQTRFKNFWY